MRRNLAISFFTGLILSAIALFFAFRNVPLHSLWFYLLSINYLWTIPSILLGLTTFLLRTMRWQLILESERRVSFSNAFHPIMIGFMMNCILPGRIGEVARPVILNRRSGIPVSTGLATVGVERVFDIGFLLLLFAVVLASISIPADFAITYGGFTVTGDLLDGIFTRMLAATGILIGIICLSSIKTVQQMFLKAVSAIPRIFPPGMQERVEKSLSAPLKKILGNIFSGFVMIKSPKKVLLCLVFTSAIWILSIIAVYLMAFGSPGISISLLQTTGYFVVICIVIAIPSVPGFWGIWEAGGVFALTFFGIKSGDAAGFTLANHAVQIIPVIITGIISAFITGIRITGIRNEIGKF